MVSPRLSLRYRYGDTMRLRFLESPKWCPQGSAFGTAEASLAAVPDSAFATCEASRSRLFEPQLPPEVRHRRPQPLVQGHLGLPPEQRLRPADVRPALLGIVLRQRADRADPPALPHHPAYRLGELDQRHLARIAEVHRPRVALLRERHQAGDQVVDV